MHQDRFESSNQMLEVAEELDCEKAAAAEAVRKAEEEKGRMEQKAQEAMNLKEEAEKRVKEAEAKVRAEEDVVDSEAQADIASTLSLLLCLAGPREDPSGNLLGNLEELRTGQFEDAAKGLARLLQVSKSWDEQKECSVEGMQNEIRRLCDCPHCADAQVAALEVIPGVTTDSMMELARELHVLADMRQSLEAILTEKTPTSSMRMPHTDKGDDVLARREIGAISDSEDETTDEFGRQSSDDVSGATVFVNALNFGQDEVISLNEDETGEAGIEDGTASQQQQGCVPSQVGGGAGRPEDVKEVEQRNMDFQNMKKNLEDQIQLQIDKVSALRNEMDEMGIWFYGSSKCQAVEMEGEGSMRMQHPVEVHWPEESIAHKYIQDLKYGQPLCERCKKLGLDWSTIAADLDYVLNQVSSEKKCFNGIRDKDRGLMTLESFMQEKEAKEADLELHELAALRFYTSHSFHAINKGLRDREAGAHPLPAIVTNITRGIKKLRAVGADGDQAVQKIDLWRGFTDVKIPEQFKKRGGSEYAPMSTTRKADVATGYAVRGGKTKEAVLMKLVTTNQLQRGADLSWLSMFPGEAETLFPPLTFMQPTGRVQVIELNGFKLTIVEVTTTLP